MLRKDFGSVEIFAAQQDQKRQIMKKWWRSKNRTNKKDLERSLMEVKKQDHQLTHQNGGGLMTDEQMELLRKQISVYATICEQLVEMHKSITTQQDIAGINLGNFYCDSLMTYAGNKITARHRWTPTAVQLQILERFFDEGSGTPSKQKIKDITSELSQHSKISEANVYNWFQNRRARSKRKQLVVAPNNAAESEVEAEMECSKEKKMKPAERANIPENTTPRDNDAYFHNPELQCLGTQYYKEKPPFPSDCSLRSYGSFGHLAVRESVPRSNQRMSKMELPRRFNPCQAGEQ